MAFYEALRDLLRRYETDAPRGHRPAPARGGTDADRRRPSRAEEDRISAAILHTGAAGVSQLVELTMCLLKV